ncbi:ATP-grasp domain-containing protein [Erythrobacter sp. EC-HK427]|uniref:ATP-grasp domain-containing protein n=1 Tax=Erythrobacter sp. EC-HK427 TaxID=2038396 RepID=UPI00125989AC|nr:ATP-grasp domain-containing protein [Erythrobacter sp. EC-HK427]VVT20599.1 conserved hypothetical protein [Erythrobacter sp. EC-HK427]
MARRVFITGARAAAALDLARDFAAAGWDVHAADCSPARIMRWSRAATKVHRYASPVADPPGFQRDVKALLEQLAPDLVLPTCEEVFHLASPGLAEALAGRLFAPPLATLRMLHDKHAFAAACQDWGIAAPESHLLTRREQMPEFAAQPGAWVFKPVFSRFGESTRIGLTSQDILNLNLDGGLPLMSQRRVHGEEVCFYAVAQAGALTAFAAYRSAWRLGGGASFAFSPVSNTLQAQLKAIASEIAQNADLTGQFACDAIIDDSGTPWLIECNPRATSGVHQLAGRGALARAIADAEPCPDTPQSETYLGPAIAVFGLPLAMRSGRVAKWRATMRNGHDAISRPGDRMPIIGALADAAGFALSGVKHGISTTSATTSDIEWNGEQLP